MTFDDLIERARALVRPGHRALLGITGSPGAGKTTLVDALVKALGPQVAHVPMDGFHLADVELDRLGNRARKGAPDTFDAHGYLALLRRIRADEPHTVYAPAFERDLEQPLAGAIAVLPEARLVITEGNYLLLDESPWRDLAEVLDETWFCAVPDDVRRARLVARHIAFGKDPAAAEAWVDAVDEPNARLVAAARDRADLIYTSAS